MHMQPHAHAVCPNDKNDCVFSKIMYFIKPAASVKANAALLNGMPLLTIRQSKFLASHLMQMSISLSFTGK